jgi:hypothetical protein
VTWYKNLLQQTHEFRDYESIDCSQVVYILPDKITFLKQILENWTSLYGKELPYVYNTLESNWKHSARLENSLCIWSLLKHIPLQLIKLVFLILLLFQQWERDILNTFMLALLTLSFLKVFHYNLFLTYLLGYSYSIARICSSIKSRLFHTYEPAIVGKELHSFLLP